MTFKCPVCSFSGSYLDLPEHLQGHGILVDTGDIWRCSCGFKAINHMMNTLLDHACNTKHNWDKILVRRELESF